MPWIQENYDKAAIGAGSILLLGLGALGAMKMGGGELTAYSPLPSKVQDVYKTPSGEVVTPPQRILKSVENGHDIRLADSQDQTYYLFVGPSLWLRKGEDAPAPLYGGKPLHNSIPNKWWVDLNMEETMRKADALEADDDGDGFTNHEEYKAETDPTDPADHPALINKLRVAEVEESKMFLRLVLPAEGSTGIEALAVGRRGVDWKLTDIKVGEKFGPKDNPERFELVQVSQQARGNLGLKAWRADFKDLAKPDQPLRQLFRGRREILTVTDVTVSFQLLGGSEKGKEITVQEGESFSLAAGGQEAPKYQLLGADKKAGAATLLNLENQQEIQIR